jgi:hypothetical protein
MNNEDEWELVQILGWGGRVMREYWRKVKPDDGTNDPASPVTPRDAEVC